MTTELVKVPFHGESLEAVHNDHGVWVSIRRICDPLNLAYSTQLQKLKKLRWATVFIMNTVAEDGKQRELAMIDLDAVPMWLGSIDTNRVAEHVRPKLELYQKECAKVLRDHFFRSTPATSPLQGFTLEQLRSVVLDVSRSLIREQLAAISHLSPALPRTTVVERCRFKGWLTTNLKQRNQIRRLANSLLDLRHGETPDMTGMVCTYFGHQVAVLDEAIDRVKEEYRRHELAAGPNLFEQPR